MVPMVRNATKHEFSIQWGQSSAFIAKNSDATLWHELLHQFDPFSTECCMATKESQMHPNSTKRTKHKSLGSNGGGSVAFVAKNSDGTSWHEVFHQSDPFSTEFCKATKQSQMHPNCRKQTKT